jgi:hypothetical protein
MNPLRPLRRLLLGLGLVLLALVVLDVIGVVVVLARNPDMPRECAINVALLQGCEFVTATPPP